MRRRELPGGIPPPTKGELKRQAQAVQDLANRLIDAPAELVDGLDLPDKLADAVALARRIKAGGALVRQKQFVAKLMRGIDLEPDPGRSRRPGRCRAPRRGAVPARRALARPAGGRRDGGARGLRRGTPGRRPRGTRGACRGGRRRAPLGPRRGRGPQAVPVRAGPARDRLTLSTCPAAAARGRAARSSRWTAPALSAAAPPPAPPRAARAARCRARASRGLPRSSRGG